jgi:Sulfotransferase domain
VEKWYKSFDEAILQTNFGPLSDFILYIVEPIIGSRGTISIRKMLLGFFRAQNVDEIRSCAKTRYVEHYETIRKTVPKEQLLNFKLTDGWGPLCAFLGKDIPDADFPWVNETKAVQDKIKMVQKRMMVKAAKKTATLLSAAVVLGASYYLAISFSR